MKTTMIKRRPGTASFLTGLLLAALGCAWVCQSAYGESEAATKTRPNVILIMTDDQGYGDVAALGNPIIRTPHLDRLHAQSVRFTDFHVNSFCAPTRAALMTGRMSDRTHTRSTVYLRNHLNREETTMAEFFKASGYRTAHFGKWHLGENYPYRPMDRGFDEWVGIGDGGLATAGDFWGNDRMNDTYLRNGQWEKIDGFNADVFFDETMKFIKADGKVPFFIYLATNVPHGPMNVKKEWYDDYRNNKKPRVRTAPWGNTIDLFATLTRFDWNLGRLRKFLAENKLDENTILIFLTDNGSANGTHIFNAGMRGAKGSLFEGGHRVPCFVHWPAGGLDKPVDVDRLTAHFDLLPTLVELCGLKTPERGHLEFDGRSLVPLLYDNKAEWDDRLIINHKQNIIEVPLKNRNTIVYSEKWRLLNRKNLYDIKADPHQNNNVAAQHPEVVADMTKKLNAFWEEIKLPDNPYPRAIVGTAHQKTTRLNSINWIRDNNKHTWSQRSVLAGEKGSGFWPVEIAAAGTYRFDVRRWPRELNRPITAGLPAQKTADITRSGKPVLVGKGKALPAIKVRLKVGEQVLEEEIGESDVSAVFEIKLSAGPVTIQAWLIGKDGNKQGAYYTYVERIR